ncbi:MAG: hypothetical protein MSA59_04330, partial [Lachnobacterium sp.]|nr:hypothetical protein [Lachnobacterium sp.]
MFLKETESLRKVVISMAKKYKKKYKRLEERYDILNEHMLDITDDNERYLNDLRYLEAFIDWKNLNEEFLYFKKNAYEKYDEDLPFSRLTL